MKNTEYILKNAAWFVENGYQSPEELIDHNAELDVPKNFFGIFAAYNQHNIAQGTAWDTWPDWELCLTSMDSDLHFENPKGDYEEIVAQREHWLALAEFIHEHQSISMQDYTITVQGQHGQTFSFDFCLEIETWGAAGTYEEHRAWLEKNAKKPKPWMWARAPYSFADQVSHSLGPWWICPDHVPEYGGLQTSHTPDSSFCLSGAGTTFPASLLSIIHLCIEDVHIWNIQYREAVRTAEYIAKVEKEWPGRRPEDYENQ